MIRLKSKSSYLQFNNNNWTHLTYSKTMWDKKWMKILWEKYIFRSQTVHEVQLSRHMVKIQKNCNKKGLLNTMHWQEDNFVYGLTHYLMLNQSFYNIMHLSILKCSESCNIFFYNMFQSLEIKQLKNFDEIFLLLKH